MPAVGHMGHKATQMVKGVINAPQKMHKNNKHQPNGPDSGNPHGPHHCGVAVSIVSIVFSSIVLIIFIAFMHNLIKTWLHIKRGNAPNSENCRCQGTKLERPPPSLSLDTEAPPYVAVAHIEREEKKGLLEEEARRMAEN